MKRSFGHIGLRSEVLNFGTKENSNAVALPGLTVSDPARQGEVQAVANKPDELLAALRRQGRGRREKPVILSLPKDR